MISALQACKLPFDSQNVWCMSDLDDVVTIVVILSGARQVTSIAITAAQGVSESTL